MNFTFAPPHNFILNTLPFFDDFWPSWCMRRREMFVHYFDSIEEIKSNSTIQKSKKKKLKKRVKEKKRNRPNLHIHWKLFSGWQRLFFFRLFYVHLKPHQFTFFSRLFFSLKKQFLDFIYIWFVRLNIEIYEEMCVEPLVFGVCVLMSSGHG